jgi:uncharacterized Zn finger protein (UPF0148 family)
MLVHVQCGCVVKFNKTGNGICTGCGKKINVRVSNK